MSSSIVTQNAPSTIEVGGVSYEIDTSFRCGIRVAIACDLPNLSNTAKAIIILGNYFKKNIPDIDVSEAVERCMEFHNLGIAESSKPKRRKERVFDWDHDIGNLIADFQREYSINLTDPNLEIHWWRFMYLFSGLCDTSNTIKAIGYRSLEVSSKLPKEEQKRLKELKKAYKLPPRSASEVTLD